MVEIGCLDCSQPSEVVMVTDDLNLVKTEWDRRLADWTEPPPFGHQRSDQAMTGWPANAISVTDGREGVLVVYQVEAT
jgi:hypothetical protein